jgi:hypothetical protein
MTEQTFHEYDTAAGLGEYDPRTVPEIVTDPDDLEPDESAECVE